ncbi:hybrid sensor histidine kinase/response regulator [Azospirillum thermophilum]|nr:PAS domain-containing hybrid sensor histidine kinase/response regulator [Azospirillum thermophilum]
MILDVASRPPAAPPADGGGLITFDQLPALERLWMPIWVFDSERARMAWANRAALELWDAPTLEDFLRRDFSDMSEATRTRLSALIERLSAGEQPVDQWTFYPRGRPVTVRVRRTAIALPDGRRAMLHEAQPLDQPTDPATLRGVEALHHTNVMISLHSAEGRPLMRNPAAMRAFGPIDPEEQGNRIGAHLIDERDRRDLLSAIAGGRVFSRELAVRTVHGEAWHGLDARPAIDPVTGAPTVLINERDITDRRRMEIELEEQRSFLRAVVDLVPDQIFVHDADGRYVLVNQALAAQIGRSTQEVEGASLCDFIPPEVVALWMRDNRQVIEAGRELLIEQTLEVEGRARHYRVSKRPFRRASGAAYVLGTAVDITDLKLAKERAEAGERAKSQFLAMMSHEIRTPMNAVVGFASLLSEHVASEEHRAWANTITTASKDLLRVLDDILDFSKIEAGCMTLEQGCVVPGELVYQVADLFAPRAAERGNSLTVRVEPRTPVTMAGDPGRLRQVIANLVSNACKFTENGRVTLTASGDGAGTVSFEVTDTGIGMTGEQAAHVFEAFRQADESVSRRFGGTGLGLAIASRIVGLMGGTISLRSQPGVGSSFLVRLPARPAMPAPAEREAPAELPSGQPGANILLVEDNRINRELIMAILRRDGHRIACVGDGVAAVEAVRARGRRSPGNPGGFDLVLMDMRMPRMNGDEATRLIRELEGPAAGVPVWGLSADAIAETVAAHMTAGLDGYLTKPIDPNRLRLVVAQVRRG